MFNKRFGRRSINLNSFSNLKINQSEIICKWFRGISLIILLFSLTLYAIKALFLSLTNETFTIKIENQDPSSSDETKRNYSYNFVDEEKNNTKIDMRIDKEYSLDKKSYGSYVKKFNLTAYQSKNKRKKEENVLYKLFKFDEIGEESHILVDYSSSLPHYPLFAEESDQCYKRGEIISKITNIVNLTCVDISGIVYEDMDFIIRISLLDKNSSEIKLFIFKEIKIKNEYEKNDGKYNVIFYGKNDTKTNLRYCSKELPNFSKNYFNLPKNYIPVIEISWPKKNHYFCLRQIRLFYEN